MPIEFDNGKHRVARERLSDIGTVRTGEERDRNHDARGRWTTGNRGAAERGSKQAIERPESSLEDALAKAPGSLPEPARLAALVADIRTVYRSTKRELGSTSPIVLSSLATFARESCLAGHFLAEAAAAGITSERGLALVELAQKAEARAERSSTHAVAMAAKLNAPPPNVIDAQPWLRKPKGGAK